MLARLLVIVLAASAASTWHEAYRRGLDALQAGDAGLAREQLGRALALRAEPGIAVPIDDATVIDYLPHLYLTIASHMAGDLVAARAHHLAADRTGAAAASEIGGPLLLAYRVILTRPLAGERPRRPAAAAGAWSDLSDDELRQRIIPRVVNGHDVDMAIPWYVWYDEGRAALTRRDGSAALGALGAALRLRPEPGRRLRTYGMWYLDYHPYLQLARAYELTGDWRGVHGAALLSQRLDELTPADPDHALRDDLLRRSRTQLAEDEMP